MVGLDDRVEDGREHLVGVLVAGVDADTRVLVVDARNEMMTVRK